VVFPHNELILVTAIAVAAAAVGVWLTGFAGVSRRIVPFSGGLLMGISLFWALPELSQRLGWIAGSAWVASGFLLLLTIDRYVYPLFPTFTAAVRWGLTFLIAPMCTKAAVPRKFSVN
jgi:hypothetical protein